MKLYEYQARELLSDFGVNVPQGHMVETVDDARSAASQILEGGASLLVIKAQVHAGGRGKAGFVKLVRNVDDAVQAAEFMLGNRMVSVQTGKEGLEVSKILVAEGVDIDHEYYLAITLDRKAKTHVLIASAEGGVDIEEVAKKRPEAIHRCHLHPLLGLELHKARQIAFGLGLSGKAVNQAVSTMMKLASLYIKTDASLAEINPLVRMPSTDEFPDGEIVAVDAKVSIDESAHRRQKIALTDSGEELTHIEKRADKAGLSYVPLDGTIGCLVNGAGLAMSTMDIIKLFGKEPANFLDVGGSADAGSVTEAFRIILSDSKVEGILVNIFGGIMPCDRIAEAIIIAAEEVGFNVPLVVRLEGTNVAKARKVLESAVDKLPTMHIASDLQEAAKLVTSLV